MYGHDNLNRPEARGIVWLIITSYKASELTGGEGLDHRADRLVLFLVFSRATRACCRPGLPSGLKVGLLLRDRIIGLISQAILSALLILINLPRNQSIMIMNCPPALDHVGA